MEELIKKVYEEKLSDGSIEKIIGDKVEEMVKSCCDDLFKWNGAIKKQMEEKIKSVMTGIVQESDFSKYIVSLKELINEALPQTCLTNYQEIIESIKTAVGEKQLTSKDTIKVSEIFEKYCEFIEGQTFSKCDLEDKDTIDYDEGMSAWLTASLSYSGCFIKLKVKGLDNDYYNYDLLYYSSTRHLEVNRKKINAFSTKWSFDAWLLMLDVNRVNIELDIKSSEEEINVEIED